MSFLYLTEQGAVLQREGERLLVTKDDQTLADVPVAKLEAVLVFGRVHLTTPALQLCLTHGVELALFTRRGRLLGQLTSPFPKNIELRRAQYAQAGDPAFVLNLAQTIVAGKLAKTPWPWCGSSPTTTPTRIFAPKSTGWPTSRPKPHSCPIWPPF